MVGRIVEHQARRVMLVEGRVRAKFWRERRTLVGTEMAAVAVDLIKISIAGEKEAAIRAAMYGIQGAQCRVGRIGIGVEMRSELIKVETPQQFRRPLSLQGSALPHERIEERHNRPGGLDMRIVTHAGNIAGLRGIALQLLQG